jgi:hypothetical protein
MYNQRDTSCSVGAESIWGKMKKNDNNEASKWREDDKKRADLLWMACFDMF